MLSRRKKSENRFLLPLGILTAICVTLACRPCQAPLRGTEPLNENGIDMQEEIVVGEESRLAGGEVHLLSVGLKAGELFEADIDQRGIDVILRLFDPDGVLLHEVDSPTGKDSDEHLLWVAEASGSYRFEVVGATGAGPPGRYLVRRLSRRIPTASDRDLLRADRSTRRGAELAYDQRWDEAIAAHLEALEVWRRLGLRRRAGETLRALGFPYYQQGDYGAAQQVWNEALAHLEDDDPRRYFVQQDLGRTALNLGQTDRAIEAFGVAIAGFEALGEARGLQVTWTSLGNALRARGALQEALDAFEQAAVHGAALDRPRLVATLRANRAALLLDLDRSVEARGEYSRALDLYRGLGYVKGMATAWRGIADACLRLGELTAAEVAARRSLKVLEGSDLDADRAAAWSALGNVHRKRAEHSAARDAFEHALDLLSGLGRPRAEGIILTALAQTHIDAGEPELGLALFDRAVEIFVAMESRPGEAMARARGAEALRRLGRPREAWARLKPVLGWIEEIRRETRRQDFRLSYFGSRQDYFSLAFELLLELHRASPREGFASQALEIHERRLARELVESLALDRKSGTAPDEKRLAREIARRARVAEVQGDNLESRISALHHLRGKVRGEASVPVFQAVGLETVRRDLLDPSTLALVYVLGKDESHLLAIGREEFHIETLPSGAAIEERVRPFLALLPRISGRSRKLRLEVARSLGQLLLEPVSDHLAGKRLLILPDGVLRQLPFAALRHPSEDVWVLERHEITTISSFSVLAAQMQAETRRTAGSRIVVFADPVFGPEDERLAGPEVSEKPDADLGPLFRAASGVGLERLRRLPGTRSEAEAIQALWPKSADILLGFSATREDFLERNWAEVGVLYLASHALAHPRPELSGLVFSLLDQDGTERLGFVTSFDIARMSIPVSLVVLSACETGIGRVQQGEGQIGLAWSFEQAGAARLAVSLWQIDDWRTARLMDRFLEHYRERGRVPEALRAAQLEILRGADTQPFDWAGFVAVGDWRETRHFHSAQGRE